MLEKQGMRTIGWKVDINHKADYRLKIEAAQLFILSFLASTTNLHLRRRSHNDKMTVCQWNKSPGHQQPPHFSP
ncbi:hypothetical protein WAI453_005522 [Rhynchosporium graminicola]